MVEVNNWTREQLYVEADKRNLKPISYSQFSLYMNCPLKWKIKYIDNIKLFSESIHLIYGTSMHNTIQYWLDVRFKHGEKEASKLDLIDIFQTNLSEEYKTVMAKKNAVKFTTLDEMNEFFNDGKKTLNYLVKHKDKYFPTKDHKLIGCEVPILTETDYNKKIAFGGFIDIVILYVPENVYTVIDLKTSTRGWRDDKKTDFSVIGQVLLYKHYFAKQFNVEPKYIDVKYVILKRKVEKNPFQPNPASIQIFEPSSGKVNINKINKALEQFITYVFDEDGNYNLNAEFEMCDNDYNCKYCEYKHSKYCNKYPLDPEHILNKQAKELTNNIFEF